MVQQACGQEKDHAVDHRQHPVHQEEALGQLLPKQVQGEGQDRMHNGLGVVEADIADQSSGQHLLFIHVLKQVLQIVDHRPQVVLALVGAPNQPIQQGLGQEGCLP